MSNIQQPKIIMQAKLQAKTTHATSPSIALLTVPWFSLVFAFLFFSAAFFSFSAWPACIIYLSSSASFCSSWAISASISAKVAPVFSARYSRLIPALRARLVFFFHQFWMLCLSFFYYSVYFSILFFAAK